MMAARESMCRRAFSRVRPRSTPAPWFMRTVSRSRFVRSVCVSLLCDRHASCVLKKACLLQNLPNLHRNPLLQRACAPLIYSHFVKPYGFKVGRTCAKYGYTGVGSVPTTEARGE